MWLILAALLSTAQAGGPPEDTAQWTQVRARSDRAFRTGWMMGFFGTVAEIGGLMGQDRRVQIGGAIVQKSGVGLMLGAGLRERRAVIAQGGSVGAGWGHTGWVLWAGGGVLDAGGPSIEAALAEARPGAPNEGLQIASIGVAFASHVLAVGQHRHNRMAAARLSRTGQPRLQWSVRPVAQAGFSGGLLRGRF